MKTIQTLLVISSLALSPSAFCESNAEGATTNIAQTVETAEPAQSPPASPAPGELQLNFHGAPLNLILEYLSDAAGFIINKEADVRGTVDVFSKHPVSKEEAVQLLNAVLKKNGYAVV